MNPSTRIKEYARRLRQHVEEQCKDKQIQRNFACELVRKSKLSSLEESKNEEQSLTVLHEEVTKDDCAFDNDDC